MFGMKNTDLHGSGLFGTLANNSLIIVISEYKKKSRNKISLTSLTLLHKRVGIFLPSHSPKVKNVTEFFINSIYKLSHILSVCNCVTLRVSSLRVLILGSLILIAMLEVFKATERRFNGNSTSLKVCKLLLKSTNTIY